MTHGQNMRNKMKTQRVERGITNLSTLILQPIYRR